MISQDNQESEIEKVEIIINQLNGLFQVLTPSHFHFKHPFLQSQEKDQYTFLLLPLDMIYLLKDIKKEGIKKKSIHGFMHDLLFFFWRDAYNIFWQLMNARLRLSFN